MQVLQTCIWNETDSEGLPTWLPSSHEQQVVQRDVLYCRPCGDVRLRLYPPTLFIGTEENDGGACGGCDSDGTSYRDGSDGDDQRPVVRLQAPEGPALQGQEGVHVLIAQPVPFLSPRQ